jgi:FtsZ-interacting cell division protein ZipA
MDTETLIGVVVGVVVVLALVVLAAWLLRRRAEQRRARRVDEADHLRGEAATRTPDVQAAEARARRADADAERARKEADAAEHAAAEAHRDLAVEQAAQEDVVRRADDLDPRVDTRTDDYRPVTGPGIKGTPPDQTRAP